MFKFIILIILGLFFITSVSAANPIAYYKFIDSGPGGDYPDNIIDYTMNGHTGIAYNTSYSTGMVGSCLVFSQGYSYVDINDHASFSFTNGIEDYDYSLSFWCKADNYSNIVFVSKGHFTDDHEYTCYSGAKGHVYFYMKDSDHTLGNFKYGRTENSISDYSYEWLNIVVTHGPANKINIFINGEYWITRENLGVNYTSMNDGHDNVSIGQVNSFNKTVKIDEVKIWDSYLIDSEVLDLYQELRYKYYTLTLMSRDILTSKNNFSVYENEKYIGTYSYQDTFNVTDMRTYTIILHENMYDSIAHIENLDDIAKNNITYIIYIIMFVGILALIIFFYKRF